MNEYIENEDTVRERRLERIREMQRRKKQQMIVRRYVRAFAPLAAGAIVVLVLLISGGRMLHKAFSGKDESVQTQSAEVENKEEDKQFDKEKSDAGNKVFPGSRLVVLQTNVDVSELITQAKALKEQVQNEAQKQAAGQLLYAEETAQTEAVHYEVGSVYGIMIDPVNNEIIAQRDGKTRMNPASMTKVLTVLVAAEHIEEANLEDTITITPDITDYGFINGCSAAGFKKNEVVTVRELFYGTILPSGAEAAVGLAVYVAGDQEAFVELMNQKLEELGLAQTTHMTNCVGVYDENHYSTPYDMAMIMEAALANEWCRTVMSAHTYVTSQTEQNPEGLELSNLFLRRIEDRDTGGEVICAKTGFVNESGSCAVSYGKDMAGNEYICVTAGAENQWKCIADHEKLYKQYAEGD